MAMEARLGERSARDLRGREGEVIRERRLETHTAAAHAAAAREPSSHEALHRRPRIQVSEACTEHIPDRSCGKSDVSRDRGRTAGVEHRGSRQPWRLPRSGHLERGTDPVDDPAGRHDGA